MALNNGLAPTQAENAELNGEHQTVDKVKLGRADQGDDAGKTFSFTHGINLACFSNDVCLIFSL